MAKIRVTLKRSLAGRPERQRATVRALGLKKLNHTVVHEDSPQVRGMVKAVSHLVEWEMTE